MAGRATKIHLAVDAQGNPLTFILSDGTTHDVKMAPDLMDNIDLSATVTVCADKGYDSGVLRAHIKQAGTCDNIPRKRNTKPSNDHMDWDLYKVRHLVENAFAKLKNIEQLPQDLISSNKVMRIRWRLLVLIFG